MIGLSWLAKHAEGILHPSRCRRSHARTTSSAVLCSGLSSDEIMKDRFLLAAVLHDWIQKQPSEKGPRRKVITWFCWGYRRMDGDGFCSMMERIDRTISPRGWQFLELYNYGNFTFGGIEGSVSRQEFFEFQKDFNAILGDLRLGLSGMLTLSYSTCLTDHDPDDPHEQYHRDTVHAGDSNGRPRRHEVRILPHTRRS